mgnify:CR=1 FL=1
MKKKFLDLGKQPLANSFLHNISKKNLKREYFYNLSVGFDKKNHQVSLTKHVNPKMQYTNSYAHRASQSQTMKKSFQDIFGPLFLLLFFILMIFLIQHLKNYLINKEKLLSKTINKFKEKNYRNLRGAILIAFGF